MDILSHEYLIHIKSQQLSEYHKRQNQQFFYDTKQNMQWDCKKFRKYCIYGHA